MSEERKQNQRRLSVEFDLTEMDRRVIGLYAANKAEDLTPEQARELVEKDKSLSENIGSEEIRRAARVIKMTIPHKDINTNSRAVQLIVDRVGDLTIVDAPNDSTRKP